jgi:MerR family transcriptional regulator, light-induced transcriptional regulator
MPSKAKESVDLRSAASEIGVHYQTAYGWIRSGRLKAQMVSGQYLIARLDLDAFVYQRRAPSAPKPPSRTRLAHSADRMHEALLAGDEPGARRTALTLVNEGSSIADVIQRAIVPALVRIGQAWHEGQLTIWVEHRASAIVERILGELSPNPKGRRRGTAVVAAVSGDQHSLPTSMAAATLREDNWHVEHLGADVPPSELVDFCSHHGVTVVIITATNPDTIPLAHKAAVDLQAAGTAAIVGGPGRTLAELIALTREATTPTHAGVTATRP